MSSRAHYSGAPEIALISDLSQLHRDKDSTVAIDMPIGLPERALRRCDIEAREHLPARKRSSVFMAPVRAVLDCGSHREASETQKRITGKGLSIQTWNIVPKMREVDTFIRSGATNCTVIEVHPELTFELLAKGSPLYSKHSKEGFEQRLKLLTTAFSLPAELCQRITNSRFSQDMLDSLAALWSSERKSAHRALAIPESGECDHYGILMQIWI